MKFRLVDLGYRSCPDYPYDYRIELTEYGLDEHQDMLNWLNQNEIPCTMAGAKPGNILYMRRRYAEMFVLRWS